MNVKFELKLTCPARVIQEELLKDFSTNSELSNWFAREDTAPPAIVVKKPHPKNVQNADKIKELEEQIQKYVRCYPLNGRLVLIRGNLDCNAKDIR